MDLRAPRGVRRITLVAPDAQGTLMATTVFEGRPRKRKKGTPIVREVERLVRRGVRAQSAMLGTYEERHERSNRKQRDGWLRDVNRNVFKASARGLRKLV